MLINYQVSSLNIEPVPVIIVIRIYIYSLDLMCSIAFTSLRKICTFKIFYVINNKKKCKTYTIFVNNLVIFKHKINDYFSNF